MYLKHKLEKHTELTEMLAANTDSDVYKEDSCVEDNEVQAKLQEEWEEISWNGACGHAGIKREA